MNCIVNQRSGVDVRTEDYAVDQSLGCNTGLGTPGWSVGVEQLNFERKIYLLDNSQPLRGAPSFAGGVIDVHAGGYNPDHSPRQRILHHPERSLFPRISSPVYTPPNIHKIKEVARNVQHVDPSP